MKTGGPVSVDDFESLVMAPIAKLKADIPRILTGSQLITGGGSIFDFATNKFSLSGTTIASFYIKDGKEAIAVSDGKVSENMLQTASLEFRKLIVIDHTTVMALSGDAGFAVLYAKMLKNWVETMERIREEPLSTRAKVNMLSKILRESLPLAMAGMVVMPILTAYDDRHGPRIFFFTPDGSVISKPKYAIAGSGRVNEGSLLQQWRPGMSREEGIELAKNIVNGAHKLDAATGGRIFIEIIGKDGVESVDGGWVNE